MLENIRVVLVETSHPGNIGSSARAMKTMGLSNLCLVNPKQFPDKQAYGLATGASDLLDNAMIVDSLKEAIGPTQLVIGVSARQRDLKIPMLNMQEFATEISHCARSQKVALVFGRERTGLSNEELACCDYHIKIPTCQEFSSLNLSQAVQIVCYELRRHGEKMLKSVDVAEPAVKMANKFDVEGFYSHLEQTLVTVKFMDPKQPKRLIPKIKRLFNRIKLDESEVNILRGILTAVNKQLSRSDLNER